MKSPWGPASIGLLLAGAAAAEPVELRLKPTGAPVTYRISVRDTHRVSGGEVPESQTWRTEEKVRQEVSRIDAERLRVLSDRLEKSLGAVGQPQVAVRYERQAASWVVGVRGEPREGGVPASAAALMFPVFPADPVEAPHEWTSEVAPTSEFPVAVSLTHRLERIEAGPGGPLAVIVTAGSGEGVDPKGTAISFSLGGELKLSLGEGLVEANTSRTVIDMRFAKPWGERQRESFHRETLRTVARVRDGAGD